MDLGGSGPSASADILRFSGEMHPQTTTISTVVLHSGPIKMVIALLQSGNTYHIKVVELEPKLTFLGTNLDEAVLLQTQHDELLGRLQGQTNPIDEFLRKVDDMVASQKPRVEILNAMESSISSIWEDVESLLLRRKKIADTNSNFHEKFETCQSKISALELACRDTMIPMEVEPVEDFLQKFKMMRTEVLASVLATLRDGKELLSLLREIASEGSLDSRPEYVVQDAIRSIKQVEIWLEQLHDRRNGLETAWQSRKDQLEQCLKLAILSKELNELEGTLNKRQNDMTIAFTLGESEKFVDHLLRDYVCLKDDAISLRDRAIKITKTVESLVKQGSFDGDEACAKSYSILARCTEFLDESDRREGLLLQAKDFFHRAESALLQIESFEVEIATLKNANSPTNPIKVYSGILSQLEQTVQQPIQLGYCLMDDVGRTRPEVMGVKRVIDEMEKRKIYLEEICTANSEQAIDVSEKINVFFSHHNQILSWLVSIAEAFIKTNSSMGTTLVSARSFLGAHHKILSDLEIRGTDINNLLLTLTPVLQHIDESQRKDVDTKVQTLHQHWTKLKDIVTVRTDLAAIYIQFLDESESLAKAFNQIEVILKNAPNEDNLKQIEKAWTVIQPSFVEIKRTGSRFIDEVSKVADPYLETKTARSNVEEILRAFSNRQFSITESCDNWSKIVTEKREVEILWERIMTDNVQTLNVASKIDSQLYPILTLPSEEPQELKVFVQKRLTDVLHEIGSAKAELQERIKATAHLEPSDEETNTKLHHVIENLQSIKTKLDGISNSYETLVISMVSFFDAILNTKSQIRDYFERTRNSTADDSIKKHERFREQVMEQFRSLISQSETIIDRIRSQEPEGGAKEHDTDRIITLLERLRITFESQAESKQNDLLEFNTLNQFKKELREIHVNLDDVTKQVTSPVGTNSVDNDSTAAAMKAVAFDYFEQTIELLGKRIENFINGSENIYLKYPKVEGFVKDEVAALKSRWNEILDLTRNRKRNLKLLTDYNQFLEEVKTRYRTHNSYLQEISAKSSFVNTVPDATDLVNQIDNYINQNETAQLNDLKRLSDMSKELYGYDKSVIVYTDNLTVFDTFLKVKSKLLEFMEIAKQEETQQKQRLLDEQLAKRSPVFTQKLIDASIPEGEQFTFYCQVMGNPTPSVEWFKDGISIQSNSDYRTSFNNGNCTLTIEETLIADTARFTCKATNDAGQDATAANLLVRENVVAEKLEAPLFSKPLATGFAKEGGKFTFECVVTGHPLPVVQWFKNTYCIDQLPDYIITYNNGQANLKIEEVFLEDQTSFTCRASNPVGVAETTANLIVEPLEPTQSPLFQTQLSNIMARVGQKIKLECEVTGIPEPLIVWAQNDKPLNNYNRDFKTHYDGCKANLIIPEAFLKDAGTYTITAKNLAGEAFSACNVSVKGRIPNETSDSELASDMEPIKPSVQMPLKDTNIDEGKPIRLDCIIVGQPEPEVIWYHEGRPVKESPDFQLIFQGDRCSLLIQEAFSEDSGEYKVVALNSAGEASSKCVLTVTPAVVVKQERIIPIEIPLQFDKLLTDVLVSEGDKVEMECFVSGQPKPEIKWFWNNKEITDNPNVTMIYTDDGMIKLILEKACIEDKGLYTVRASNSTGDIKSFSHLIVKAVNIPESNRQVQEVELEERLVCPTFRELFSDKIVPESSSTKFECIVEGKPSPKIKWYFNDEVVHGKEFLISTSGDRQVLSVPNVTKSVAGKVSCVAENEIGKATCVAYLNVVDGNGLTSRIETPETQTYSQEHNTQSSLVTIKKQTFTTTSHQHISSVENGIPQTHLYTHSLPSGLDSVDNKQYLEYHQANEIPTTIQQKSIINVTRPMTIETNSIRHVRKDVAPRFISPLIGKIVDQGATVSIEAIVDGTPTPEIRLLKNGEPLISSDRTVIQFDHNKIMITLRNCTTADAGRYSCVASNTAGSSTSVADVVVKKSIFPPVFGRRLQTQIVKVAERVIMDVEITGLPEPAVSWFKDDVPIINHPRYKLQQLGNCHKLIIENALKGDAGRYMVSAVNPGGKAESIASFAVVDSTPDRIVEVVKTVVFEDPNDHTRKTDGSQGTAESTHITETRRITEATMKMEHKPLSDFSDLAVHSTNSIQKNSSMVHSQYKAFDDSKSITKHPPLPCLEPGPEPVICFMPPAVGENLRKEVCPSPKPSVQGVAMEKLWTIPKHHDSLKYDAVEPVPDRFEGEKVSQTSITSTRKMFEEKIRHSEVQDVPLRAPNLVRSTRPWQERPKSDIYSGFSLEPGSPPEICYAPKPAFERKKSMIETLEENIERQLEVEPARVPPGGVRLLPHKREKSLPPVLRPQTPVMPAPKIEPKLEPFPFQVPETVNKKCVVTLPPPPTPSKFVKGTFSDTNYESDFSDYSCFENKFKHVEPPRSKSIEPIGVSSSDEKPIYDFKTLPLKQMIQEGRPILLPSHTPPNATNKPSFSQKPISGYMADTEDHYQSRTHNHIYDSQFMTSTQDQSTQNQSTIPGFNTKEVSTSSLMKNISMTSKQIKIMEEPLIPMEYGTQKSVKLPPLASPSKFVKGEFKESDYESEFESRVAPIWRPTDSDSEPTYRPVRVNLTPTGRQSKYLDGARSPPTTPPTQFDRIPQFEGPPRPKFKPIEKPMPNVQFQTVHKPTPVTASSGHPKMSTNYFTAVAGQPVHNAIETSNTVQMREHTESSHRVVNVNKTTRIINFDNQLYENPEPFPYQSSSTGMATRVRVQPPPTPTKFVKGEFRESDYDSEVESAKIRPIWTPNPSDSEEPHFRHVNPPRSSLRSSSCPRAYPQERVLTPMEFDKDVPVMPANDYYRKEIKSQTMDQFSSKQYQTNQPSPTSQFNQVRYNAEDMSRSFKQKANQFIHDLSGDMNRPQKPILKKPSGDPQAYRDESRISQYGTKCIDPDTGLIYFKYDFGYEFGILFPGEGKKFVGGLKRDNQVTTRAVAPRSGDIVMPVTHERTKDYSGFNGNCKRYSLPVQIDLDHLHDQQSISNPYAYLRDNSRSKSIPLQPDLPVNYHQNHNARPKHPPNFITPLKDIAVVSGQSARFECIVQSDPLPAVFWTKNGCEVGPNDRKYYTEFRNGVCRLTIPRSSPDDGGVFSCTASNALGTVTTSAHLLVPADKWGTRK